MEINLSTASQRRQCACGNPLEDGVSDTQLECRTCWAKGFTKQCACGNYIRPESTACVRCLASKGPFPSSSSSANRREGVAEPLGVAKRLERPSQESKEGRANISISAPAQAPVRPQRGLQGSRLLHDKQDEKEWVSAEALFDDFKDGRLKPAELHVVAPDVGLRNKQQQVVIDDVFLAFGLAKRKGKDLSIIYANEWWRPQELGVSGATVNRALTYLKEREYIYVVKTLRPMNGRSRGAIVWGLCEYKENDGTTNTVRPLAEEQAGHDSWSLSFSELPGLQSE